MSGESASAFVSLWCTYWLRSAAAYVLLGLLCRLIYDPQLRSRLYGIFLGVMAAAWMGLLWLPATSVPSSPAGPAIAGVFDMHRLWTLSLVLTPRLAAFVSRARWDYFAILSVLVALFWIRIWRLGALLRSSRPAPEALTSLLESVSSAMEVAQCELRIAPGIRSPAVAGWRRPKILLPDGLLTQLDATQLTYIFRHELMHVRRADYLWDKVTVLACYLLFFHPAAWLVRRRLRRERELVCDDAVVQRSQEQRLDYAVCLTTVAKWQLSERFGEPVEFLSSPPLLRARVRALIAPPVEKYSRFRTAAVGVLAVTVVLIAISLAPVVWLTPAQTTIAAAPHHADRMDESTLMVESRTPQPAGPVARKRHKSQELDTIAPDVYSRFEAPGVGLPSSTPAIVSSTEPPAVVGLTDAQTHPASPAAPRWKFLPKAGAWAVRSAKLAVSKVGSGIAVHVHGKASSGS